MIVPMKKVSLVLLESERLHALKKLRKQGLVHVNEVEGNSQSLTEAKNKRDIIELAISLLSEYKIPKKFSFTEVNSDVATQKAYDIVEMFEKKKSLEDKVIASRVELDRFALWGDVDLDKLSFLASKDIKLYLYEIDNKKYETIPEEVQTVFLNKDKNTTRFLYLANEELSVSARPQGMPPEAYSVTLPSESTETIRKNIESYKAEIAKLSEGLKDSLQYLPSIKNALKTVGKVIEFENLYSGLDKDGEGDYSLCWLTGYIPTEDTEKLSTLAKDEHWAIAISEPEEDDEVPTKLKNNRFVKLIYPVSDFLGTVPGYREYDISGWIFLFLTIFVGMIFGDGGYGGVMVLMALVGILSAVSKKKTANPAMFLLLVLGLATMVWGAITCNWFGINPELLPDFMRNMSITALSSDYATVSAMKGITVDASELWVKQNVQIFCFALALIQLTIAHVKGIVRYIKSPKMLGELGQIFMLFGMFYVVLSMVVDGTRFPFTMPIPIPGLDSFPMLYAVAGSIGLGFVLSFVFSSYEGSLKDSILDSCKNIVSVLLGVINVFADIVSYIRLWAVGLAGSAIAVTVNDMAGPMLGGAMLFFGILLLVFGQGFNMVLNVLSVIVHGVRLNTLEFSNHLGMTWSGHSYKPFEE